MGTSKSKPKKKYSIHSEELSVSLLNENKENISEHDDIELVSSHINKSDSQPTILEDEEFIILPSKTGIAVGKTVTSIFAISSGVTGVGSLAKSVKGIPFYISAVILFLGSAHANYKLVNKEVISIISLGPKAIFSSKNKPMKGFKLISLIIASFWAICFGVAIGFLGREAGLTLPNSFEFLSKLGPWIEIPVDISALITLTALCGLMIKTAADLITSEETCGELKKIFNKIFAEKSFINKLFTGFAIGFLASVTLALVLIGQRDTLAACKAAQMRFILKLNENIEKEADLVTTILTEVFSLLIQLPFTFKTVLKPIIFIFLPSKENIAETTVVENTQPKHSKLLFLTSFINSIASAFIALSGRAFTWRGLIGALGAAINTLLGSIGNNLELGDDVVVLQSGESKTVVPVTPVAGTAYIHQAFANAGLDDDKPRHQQVIIEISALPGVKSKKHEATREQLVEVDLQPSEAVILHRPGHHH